MTLSFTGRKRIRKSFGRIQTLTTMPNLIEIQKTSYDHFLQHSAPPEDRGAWGLQDVFESVFPILDFSGRTELSFVKYEFDKPKYDVEASLGCFVNLGVWTETEQGTQGSPK